MPRHLDLRLGALALPAAAALAVLAFRGREVVTGEGARSFSALAASGGAGLGALAVAWLVARRSRRAERSAEGPAVRAAEVPEPIVGPRAEVPPEAGPGAESPRAAPGFDAAAEEEVEELDILPFSVDEDAPPYEVPLASPLEPLVPAPHSALDDVDAPAVLARLNLGLVLSQVLATASFAPGVSVRRVGGGASALADERLLREALERLLRVAAAAMPAGGHLALRASRREGEVVLEIADSGSDLTPTPDLLAARRLLVAQGGSLERLVAPGRGALSRVTLPSAPRSGEPAAPP